MTAQSALHSTGSNAEARAAIASRALLLLADLSRRLDRMADAEQRRQLRLAVEVVKRRFRSVEAE